MRGRARSDVRQRDATAVALLGAYLLSAFVWRTWRQWRTTGDTGLRLATGGTSAERTAGALFLGSVAAGVAAVLTGDRRRSAARRGVGIGLMVLGVFGTLASQLDLGPSWRIGVDPAERTDLVTTGAFSVVRNPIFTAMAVFTVGTALVVSTPLGWASAAAMFAAIEAQVRLVEEPYLLRTHGEDYVAYREQVGRFFPRVTTRQG